MFIFVFIPFTIYVGFSIYFWYKRHQFKKVYNPSRRKQKPKELKIIIWICYLYIALNVLTGLFSCYNTFESIDELKRKDKALTPKHLKNKSWDRIIHQNQNILKKGIHSNTSFSRETFFLQTSQANRRTPYSHPKNTQRDKRPDEVLLLFMPEHQLDLYRLDPFLFADQNGQPKPQQNRDKLLANQVLQLVPSSVYVPQRTLYPAHADVRRQ